MAMPEGSTLYDLMMAGVYTHAAVGVLVHLRKELSLVKDIPVLIAIDQYNIWFTFSEYQEPVTVRSCKPIHARDLSMVNAFRSMMHEDMMVVHSPIQLLLENCAKSSRVFQWMLV